MSAVAYIQNIVFPAMWKLLPDKMNSREAKAMMLAIGMQESRFIFRHQQTGPAGGFWEFEEAGVRGVMGHPASRGLASDILSTMSYAPTVAMIQDALDHNDILAAVMARLLLWTHPAPLPREGEYGKAYSYYLTLWRPGHPRPETFPPFYQEAWRLLN